MAIDDEHDEREDVAESDEGQAEEPETSTPSPRASISSTRNGVSANGRKSRLKGGMRADRAGFSAVPRNNPPWQYREAELLWPEILAALESGQYPGESPYNIEVRVTRESPPPRAVVGTVDGASVLGDDSTSPGQSLINYVDDYVHMPTIPGEARYDLVFAWKAGPHKGQMIARGMLNRPPRDQIVSQRAAAQVGASSRSATFSGRGFVAPPSAQHAPTPYGYPQYAAHYPPPPAYYPPPPPGVSGNVEHILDWAKQVMQMQAASQAHPPPPPPPPSSDPTMERMASALSSIERRLAALESRASGAAAAPATPEAAGNPIVAKATGMAERAIDMALAHVERAIVGAVRQQFGVGLGSTPGGGGIVDDTTVAAAAPAEVMPPENPKDNLPFQEVKLESKWPDGSPVIYTPSKDGTGVAGVHPIGFVTDNPFVTQKLVDGCSAGLNRIMNAVGAVFERAAGVSGSASIAPTQRNVPAQTQPLDAVDGQRADVAAESAADAAWPGA